MEYSNSNGTGRWSDWTRVVGAPASAVGCLEKNDEEGEGDQRFAGTSGGVEDDVVAGEEFEDGFFLVVVELDFSIREVVEKGVEDVVRGWV